jgi:hypothetical protein
MSYTDNAVKTITKATPTVDLNNKVIKWDIEIEYSFNDYVSKFYKGAEVEATKSPETFTKAELWELVNETHLDTVFDSMYVSTHSTHAPLESRVDGFDVDSLK